MKHVIVTGALLLFSVQGWSWGSLGHRTSAKIAWQFMDPQTQAQVEEILQGQNIADAAVWADAARATPEWSFTTWYHFEKAPDNYTYLDNLQRLDEPSRRNGGLIEALFVADETFRDPMSTRTDRENALKFAIHFIGDIHQPLHTGRADDNGGNKIRMRWQGRNTNLHSVWDSQIIYLGHKEMLAAVDPESVDHDQAQTYADYLMTKYKDLQPTPEMFGRYDDWMHESMVPRTDAYDHRNESEEEYTRRFLDVIDRRIYMAGMRIAYMTRQMLSYQQPHEPLHALRDAIVEIIGDFTEFVSVKPRYDVHDGQIQTARAAF